MKKRFLLGSLVLGAVLVLAGCGGGSGAPEETPAAPPADEQPAEGGVAGTSDLHVVASNWAWDLSQTTFKAGQPINIEVEGESGVHGFQIQGTDVNLTVQQGKTATATWTPEDAGEYTAVCSIPCGNGHADMVAKITVE